MRSSTAMSCSEVQCARREGGRQRSQCDLVHMRDHFQAHSEYHLMIHVLIPQLAALPWL